jgi:hypothetical protein
MLSATDQVSPACSTIRRRFSTSFSDHAPPVFMW